MDEQTAADVATEQLDGDLDDAWRTSLMAVMRDVVTNLPDDASLGELVKATRDNPQLEPVLKRMTVQELIDMARQRPAPVAPRADGVTLDEDGNPTMDLPDSGAAVVRRRADVPDADVLVLRTLSENGPMSEPALSRKIRFTSEQLKATIRQLGSCGQITGEGTGAKKKLRITRAGNSHLRKQK